MKKPVLEMNNVSKTYDGSTKALQGLSLSVYRNELISIIGPSGAGKSTLLRCINRMIEPDEGSRIRFDGNEIATMNKRELREVRKHVGMVFQHYNLVYRLSALENTLHGRLGYYSTLKGALSLFSDEDVKRACELLDSLGLEDRKLFKCGNLSGGQKQRVGIARALIQDPKLILCDEPIASLDPQSSKNIMEQLKRITRDMGIPCLVNLHQVDVALAYSDRIIGMNNGEIVFEGRPEQLTEAQISKIYGASIDELIAS
ncbi:phosphonate transport system ATP-binding protein [Dethiosulfatibacter aminovorans DSM 17477]|uniref:Phosphonate transport system ATP-binding protein n=1 Tax=Dethiosulfatibacter aminovorans DSM 17477 TaxID=1121476 RepID=A0A1M6AZ95_9FIRM|nr:phosphonate ABC transporter ATP-binding protein [Dethiosulfatibacter aminovorans]SHI41761.1 phosphonate transport system ATP-binding protein [Dethiosulfatibacter aminovorans DSM 17477]